MLSAWWVVPAGLVIASAVWRSGRSSLPPTRLAARLVLVAYLTWLTGQAFFPLPLPGSGPHEASGATTLLEHVRVTPLASIRELVEPGVRWPGLRVLLGNVVLFVPIGLLLPAAATRAAAWKSALLSALAAGFVIELGQLALSAAAAFPYRYVETDDVLLNAVGVLTGFGLWRAGRRHKRRHGCPLPEALLDSACTVQRTPD